MDSVLDASLLAQGGPIMWLLFLVSLIGFTMFVERLLFLHRGQIRTNDFLAGLKNLLRKRRLIEAVTVCEETPGPVANVVKAALLHFHEGEERCRLAIQGAAMVEVPMLERRLGTIGALGRLAPLLGLLGTLIGLMEGLNAAGESASAGYPTYGQMLAGIGEALYTSAAGLAVMMMAMLAHHFLYGRIRALVYDMEYAGHDLLQFLMHDYEQAEVDETVHQEGTKTAEPRTSQQPAPSTSAS